MNFPFRFAPHLYGRNNVIVDSTGSKLASNVPAEEGLIMVAAPILYLAMKRLAEEGHEIAVDAIEAFEERAGIVTEG